MEYRFEADGDSFCDPENPRRAPGAFGEKSVVEFPGYRAAGLARRTRSRPRPSRVADHARVWSPPDTDPRRPLPLLVAHDGSEYEQLSQLTRLIAHAIAANRIPPCRVALLDAPDRNEAYSASRPLRPRSSPPPSPSSPRPPPTPVSARASARSRCCTRAGCTRARSARSCSSPAPSSASAGTGQESGFPRFRRISRFVGTVLNASRAATPIPITLTCGAPEENLANNRAVATALRRQGHDAVLHVNRDAHNYVGWRDALDPHLVDAPRARLGVGSRSWRARISSVCCSARRRTGRARSRR